jgi:alkanesulfonate monooxygenase SsuD/methylene tetrahydromethanopterin reductase-like flavin-dependent oxidoreductase (luciferase family)
MYGRSRLKLGVFGPNMSSGVAQTKAAERWPATWDGNLELARMLDEAGIDFILPVGRWKGNGGETNPQSSCFETVTWACGLLAATSRITIFGTVHAPLVHPVFAAKQFVTADHIGRGRFGLNVVCGWNQDEFDMFGAQQREHDVRYAYGAEWLEVVKRIWSEADPFDYEGEFLRLRAVVGDPKPYGGTHPIIMNAGSSPTGRQFAIRNCDFLFFAMRTLEQAPAEVRSALDAAREAGRDDFGGVFTTVNIVCRPTQREADEYFHHYAVENADWGAVDHMFSIGSRNANTTMQPEVFQRLRIRFAAGYGGYPIVGDPDRVAADLAKVAEAGYGGVAMGIVNYLDEFPYFRAEVLPRLERLGLREGVTR